MSDPSTPHTPHPTLHTLSDRDLLGPARDVLRMEAEAVAALADRVGEAFVRACRLVLECRGRVVVTGMGKSGAIARKLAATLASTGTPALFLHPAEGVHGDLGMVAAGDVVLALSYSGESDEVLAILPVLKRLGIRLVAMTGNPQSTLAQYSEVVLDVSVPREACPHNLAPTSSTTAALALGDALALAVMRSLGFPVIYDATHSLQLPGGQGTASGAQREYAPHLMRAAAAAGIDALFIETHPDPNRALSDAAAQLPLADLPALLRTARAIHEAARA